MSVSAIKYAIPARELAARKPVVLDEKTATAGAMATLPTLGIHGMDSAIAVAMDTALVGPAGRSGATLQQFLQIWLPGLVRQLTSVRTIDRLAGITEAGNWYDDVVVQGVSTPVGKAELYGDSSNVPLANYGHTYETRGVVRFEQGFQVNNLEEAREAAGGINMAAEKRGAAVLSLEIARNRAGFVGYASGAAGVYGLLNDPGLPAYTSAAKTYATMTFDELTAEVAAQIASIITNSGGNIDQNSQFVWAMPVGYQTYLTKPNSYGQTVASWLRENYPNVRLEFAPEFTAANGGANVAYFWAERIEDGSTDGGAALTQVVPAKFFNIGSERRVKGYIEDFGSATAGVLVKRPYLFVRRTAV